MRQLWTHQLPTNATQNGTGYHSLWTTQTFVIPYAAALGEGEQWACQVLLSQYLLLRSSNCLNFFCPSSRQKQQAPLLNAVKSTETTEYKNIVMAYSV